jgi:hypothetical protein
MNRRSLLFLTLISLILVGSAHAASLLEMESGVADGSFLQVKASGIASATSLQFDLTYNPAVVSVAGIQKAAGYQGVSMTTNTNVPGTARVLIIFPDPVTIDASIGVVEVAFSSVAAGTGVLGLEDARWSDFPEFKSIPFDGVSGGTVASTIQASGSSGGSSSGSDRDSSSGTTTVTAAPTAEPTWDPGFLSTQDDGSELPALPEATPVPVQTGGTPDLTDVPALPEATPAPLAFLPVLFVIPFIRKLRKQL